MPRRPLHRAVHRGRQVPRMPRDLRASRSPSWLLGQERHRAAPVVGAGRSDRSRNGRGSSGGSRSSSSSRPKTSAAPRDASVPARRISPWPRRHETSPRQARHSMPRHLRVPPEHQMLRGLRMVGDRVASRARVYALQVPRRAPRPSREPAGAGGADDPDSRTGRQRSRAMQPVRVAYPQDDARGLLSMRVARHVPPMRPGPSA